VKTLQADINNNSLKTVGEVVNIREQQCWGQHYTAVVYPIIFFGGGSTNSAEDRGQREWGTGGSSLLVRVFIQMVNERNPYSD
jgi:hypothetical protein